ncbi:MAG: ribonuclease Z [Bacteroidota bacterium]
MSFELTILGSSSATPTYDRFPSSQHLVMLDHHILIDCGEGAQIQMRRYKLKRAKLKYIFISHMHGDHILGLPGLLFSMNLLQRTEPLHIFGPPELFEVLQLLITHSDNQLRYEVIPHITQHHETEVIFEDSMFQIKSFPLFHRIPTTGFLFTETDRPRKLNSEACKKHQIPYAFYNELKKGLDYTDADAGIYIPNDMLTLDSGKKYSYAYCSDTVFDSRVAESVKDVRLMYHEATFMHDKLARAQETMHTTAKQAALIAKEANAEKLLIGHFSSRYDDLTKLLQEAQSEFENTELALEGRKFILTD